MSAQRAHEGVSTRNVERDMTLRPLIGFRITCMTTPLIPAMWTGISGVSAGMSPHHLSWSRCPREIPIRERGLPDRRAGRSLVVRAGGRRAFTLYDRVWSPAEQNGLARELSARASRVRSTELGHA